MWVSLSAAGPWNMEPSCWTRWQTRRRAPHFTIQTENTTSITSPTHTNTILQHSKVKTISSTTSATQQTFLQTPTHLLQQTYKKHASYMIVWRHCTVHTCFVWAPMLSAIWTGNTHCWSFIFYKYFDQVIWSLVVNSILQITPTFITFFGYL